MNRQSVTSSEQKGHHFRSPFLGQLWNLQLLSSAIKALWLSSEGPGQVTCARSALLISRDGRGTRNVTTHPAHKTLPNLSCSQRAKRHLPKQGSAKTSLLRAYAHEVWAAFVPSEDLSCITCFSGSPPNPKNLLLSRILRIKHQSLHSGIWLQQQEILLQFSTGHHGATFGTHICRYWSRESQSWELHSDSDKIKVNRITELAKHEKGWQSVRGSRSHRHRVSRQTEGRHQLAVHAEGLWGGSVGELLAFAGGLSPVLWQLQPVMFLHLIPWNTHLREEHTVLRKRNTRSLHLGV